MPQTINTNIASLTAQRNLNGSQSALSTSMQRLSSGLRVNSAKDDAAGLGIAERMNAQVRGMNAAIRNANDGISMSQVAEGGLGKITDMMQRMRELAVQARNGTNNTSDRDSLNQEYQELAKEVDRVVKNTMFNGKAILAADAATTVTFQVGAGTTTNDVISVKFADMSSDTKITSVSTTASSNSISTDAAGVATVIQNLDNAIDLINSQRAVLGATQSRFDAVISNLQIATENQAAARSRIMDADFAAETASLSRAQVLQQAGNAMVAQANQLPQSVLKLLQG